MSDDVVAEALATLFAELLRDLRAGLDLGAKLAAKKPLKDAFKPLAASFKHRADRPEVMLQKCLELPREHPLQRAAAALVAAGKIPWTPWTPLPVSPQPKRPVHALRVSTHEPVVYALELAPCVSVWSLDTGEHLRDLKIPGKGATSVAALVELEDKTLRALSNRGHVVELAPGQSSFVPVLDLGSLQLGFACTEDLARALTLPSLEATAVAGGHVIRVQLHDCVARTSRTLELPFSSVLRSFVRFGDEVLVAGRQLQQDGSESHALALVHLRTGNVELVSLGARSVETVGPGARPGVAALLVSWDGEPARGYANIDFEVATRRESPGVPVEPDPDRFTLLLPDGRRYDPARGVLADGAGAEQTAFKLTESSYNRVAAWDSARGQLVLAGSEPGVSVTVFAPFDPARGAKAP
jgi:hypothetical protein